MPFQWRDAGYFRRIAYNETESMCRPDTGSGSNNSALEGHSLRRRDRKAFIETRQ